MRVALLVSTLAFLAGSPAFAQCVYVACNGGNQGGPVYQQPVYQQPAYQPPAAQMAPPSGGQNAASDYDDGYAAGLAARPAARATARPTARSTARRASHAHRAAPVRAAPVRAKATATRSHAAPVAKRRVAVATHAAPKAQVRAHARTTTRRHVVATNSAPRRATAGTVRTTSNTNTRTNHGYQDQIKDRAATYRPPVYGQSTTMASLMSRGGSYSSTTTTWSGPASVVRQGGQVCGWGARIVTNNHGYAQRQAMWVCQCPQGWRPPGY